MTGATIGRMKALRIDRHGSLDELAVRETDDPTPGPGEVRVRVEAAGLNPSDVGSARGAFAGSPLPRTLGRDFAGVVESGPPELAGAAVWGSGGDLGLARDGTHAGLLVVPATAVARRPPRLAAEDAAASGVPYVTAWLALDAARLAAGETVVVTGATGAVGHAALHLARLAGARTVAVVRHAADAERVTGPADAVASLDAGDLAAAVGPAGAGVALNAVGAAVFAPLAATLAEGGRMAVYAVTAGREAALDLFTLYRRRLAILGVVSTIDASRCAAILDRLGPHLASGALRPVPVAARVPLASAPDAYRALAAGARGKRVLVP
jgi:NADPH:quinone reductase-like Zn-dependent oxidoreductase